MNIHFSVIIITLCCLGDLGANERDQIATIHQIMQKARGNHLFITAADPIPETHSAPKPLSGIGQEAVSIAKAYQEQEEFLLPPSPVVNPVPAQVKEESKKIEESKKTEESKKDEDKKKKEEEKKKKEEEKKGKPEPHFPFEVALRGGERWGQQHQTIHATWIDTTALVDFFVPINCYFSLFGTGGYECVALRQQGFSSKTYSVSADLFQLGVVSTTPYPWEVGLYIGERKTFKNFHTIYPNQIVTRGEPGGWVSYDDDFLYMMLAAHTCTWIGIDYDALETVFPIRRSITAKAGYRWEDWEIEIEEVFAFFQDRVDNRNSETSLSLRRWLVEWMPCLEVGYQLDYGLYRHNIPDYYTYDYRCINWGQIGLHTCVCGGCLDFDYAIGWQVTSSRTDPTVYLQPIVPLITATPVKNQMMVNRIQSSFSYPIWPNMLIGLSAGGCIEGKYFNLWNVQGEFSWQF